MTRFGYDEIIFNFGPKIDSYGKEPSIRVYTFWLYTPYDELESYLAVVSGG